MYYVIIHSGIENNIYGLFSSAKDAKKWVVVNYPESEWEIMIQHDIGVDFEYTEVNQS